MKQQIKLPKISAIQGMLAFHKFIHDERGKKHRDSSWNKLDEAAYQAALTGMFEFSAKECENEN